MPVTFLMCVGVGGWEREQAPPVSQVICRRQEKYQDKMSVYLCFRVNQDELWLGCPCGRPSLDRPGKLLCGVWPGTFFLGFACSAMQGLGVGVFCGESALLVVKR